jgi:ATP-dependent HslUV protease subunit HslV
MKATTVIGVLKDGKAVIGADGQVTMGETVIKHTAQKIFKLYKGQVLAGFAGAVADAFTLFESLERKIEDARGDLVKACVNFAKEWRTDKFLRRLEAIMIVLNKEKILIVSGNGEVVEPEESVAAIGSGGNYAHSAALALLKHTNLSAREIALESLKIAARLCIYTNEKISILEI